MGSLATRTCCLPVAIRAWEERMHVKSAGGRGSFFLSSVPTNWTRAREAREKEARCFVFDLGFVAIFSETDSLPHPRALGAG